MTALPVIDAQRNQFDSAYWPAHAPDALLGRLRDLVVRSRSARTPSDPCIRETSRGALVTTPNVRFG